MTDYAELRRQAIALRQQGFSLAQIARQLSVHKSVVGRWVVHVPFTTHNEQSRLEQLASFRDNAKYARACELRRAGWSYSMITGELGVNQSTLSGWLRDVPVEDRTVIEGRSRAARKVSGQKNSARFQAQAQQARDEGLREIQALFADGLTERELFLVGLTLYWGEGAKTHNALCLTNSDPAVIKLFIRWTRECLNIANDRLKAEIHCYPDTDIEAAQHYWSNLTSIPLERFYKTQVDTRTNKSLEKQGKLEFGTVHIKVLGKGGADLHRKVLTWIEFLGRMEAP